MATVIKLKRSTTASAVPTTSDLADGEIGVNITDQKIYIRSGGSIVELATSSNAGVATFNTGNFTVSSGDVTVTAIDGGTF